MSADRTTSKIGQLLDGSEERDAIHIAVLPVMANDFLRPGEPVGVNPHGQADRTGVKAIGIVDPYLTEAVRSGQRFYLFLFPGTITSLRHDWTHPAVTGGQAEPLTPVAESRAWVTKWAEQFGRSFDSLMAAADNVADGGEKHDFAENRYPSDVPNESYTEAPTFWKHYEILRGKKVEDHEKGIFWCGC